MSEAMSVDKEDQQSSHSNQMAQINEQIMDEDKEDSSDNKQSDQKMQEEQEEEQEEAVMEDEEEKKPSVSRSQLGFIDESLSQEEMHQKLEQ